MIGRPVTAEASPYYFRYIDRVSEDDPRVVLQSQLEKTLPALSAISESASLMRYAPDKWTIREVLSHITDCERIFSFRALWFARGLSDPLPGFEEETLSKGAEAERLSWSEHVREFQAVRQSTILMFDHLPDDAWNRTGVASGATFTVRAISYIIAGHLIHHMRVLNERYGTLLPAAYWEK